MPSTAFQQRCDQRLTSLRQSGQLKTFHTLTTPMAPIVQIEGRGEVLVLCSNNYLGLSDHPQVIAAGVEGLRQYGAGTASVRFICGTLACHRQLEETIARFSGSEASLSYVSCWNANEASLPALCDADDVMISDELNHASIIDACRLITKKAEKAIYRHSDMQQLEQLLKKHQQKACRWVVTDGVFSMEGDVARLPQLIQLCRQYDAMLIVDDSHGVGVLGTGGRGTAEHFDLFGKVDVITGTLGKALGGGAGGYVAASRQAIEMLSQRARPSLFSNALPATVACSAKAAIEIIEDEPQRVARLHGNVAAMRQGLADLGYPCQDSPTAIMPIMIGDEAEAIAKGERLMELGVMVVGFAYPVVPKGEARLRVQVSAALESHHIQQALDAFAKL